MPHYLEVGEGHKNGHQVLNWTTHAKHLLQSCMQIINKTPEKSLENWIHD